MFPVVLPLWWVLVGAVTRLFLPLPCQNTSEMEGGGDGHQSSINTLPDISLVRHRAAASPWHRVLPQFLPAVSPTDGCHRRKLIGLLRRKGLGCLNKSSVWL